MLYNRTVYAKRPATRTTTNNRTIIFNGQTLQATWAGLGWEKENESGHKNK